MNAVVPATDTSGEVPVRIYAPKGKRAVPVLVYFHGGAPCSVLRVAAIAAALIIFVSAGQRWVSPSALSALVYRKQPEHLMP